MQLVKLITLHVRGNLALNDQMLHNSDIYNKCNLLEMHVWWEWERHIENVEERVA